MSRFCKGQAYHASGLKMTMLAACLLTGIVNASEQKTANHSPIGSLLVQSRNFQNRLKGQEAFILVPENRNHSASRLITVHFFRFPAREPSRLPPVFILTGGPGQAILANDIESGLRYKSFNKIKAIEAFNQIRDVIIVNQRGNHRLPGVQKLPSSWTAKPGDWTQPMSFKRSTQQLVDGLAVSLKNLEQLNIDLKGYDILHLIDDVDAIRRAYGYDKIALRGGSFGSQWALGYLKRYPNHVDRMILSGIEPLDHGYDSAEGIWNVFAKIEEQARDSKKLTLPKVGLLGAIKAIIMRLGKEPIQVRGKHPRRNIFANVVIGADDFRYYLTRPILDSRAHSRKMLELWPKFIMEIYQQDYQYLASKIIDDRPENKHYGLLLTLIDNSLGITDARQKKLESEPAYRWLGDPNHFYKATREITPTTEVDDEFRKLTVSQIPVLFIHGSLDLATPIENTEELLPYFPQAHLITVKGGTHFATYQAANIDSRFLEYLTTFMNSKDLKTDIKKIPQVISLPALQIKPVQGKSLFDELVQINK